ncbi:hypothetical protein ACHAQA_005573 [Verticillium albo-atrum]
MPSHDAEIKSEIFLGSLVGPDDFEALSYTWGTLENPATIWVQSRVRQVTQNLAAALRRMRDTNNTRVLWVDALCINQADEAEKSLQVAQMRQVYTSNRNKQVVVWLGDEGTARTALAFFETLKEAEEYTAKHAAVSQKIFPGLTDVERLRMFERLSDKLDRAADAGMTAEEFTTTVATPAERAYLTQSQEMEDLEANPTRGVPALIDGYETERAACEAFFARPWWSRTWILQEAIHARDVSFHIGNLDPIPIDDLCHIAARYQRYINIRTGQLRSRANNPKVTETWFPNAATNFSLWLFISGTARNTVDTILSLRAKYAAEGEAAAAPLRELLLQLRNQLATDPRDKIYGLLGFSTNEYALEPDYRLSKEELYTMLTRRMTMNVLYALLWVESPEREIKMGSLPSWVPDHSMPQKYTTITMNQQWYKFSANKNFPAPEPAATVEPHLSQAPSEKTLILRGIRVGEITEVRDVQISREQQSVGDNTVRLIGYEAGGIRYGIDGDDGVPGTIRTASWGPCHAAVGDTIIVAPGSSMPFVLRWAAEAGGGTGGHLFVGACWLVNSELQDVNQLGTDPGFSPVMFGSACVGAQPGDVDNLLIY